MILKEVEEGSTELVEDCVPVDEVCDGVDNNCDGEVDEGLLVRTYMDTDGDGYGDLEEPVDSCSPPDDTVTDSSDCDDSDPAVNPGEEEACDGADNDCDGDIDEGLDTSVWYTDLDGDLYGDPGVSVRACAQPPGTVAEPGDCNDSDPTIHPESEEVCDGEDQDCDELVDEDVTVRFYADADHDGFGTEDAVQDACTEPSGYISVPGDCDDLDPDVHPGVEDICDGVDQDCDGIVDEDGGDLVYADADSDGYGDPDISTVSCSEIDGYVFDDSDCDDTDSTVHPDAADEECNDVDNDCDGSIDEDATDTDDDGTSDCLDSIMYEHSFEDEEWGEWSPTYLGDTPPFEDWGTGRADWYFDDGYLCEESDVGNEVAVSASLGVFEAPYSVQVSAVAYGRANNGLGLVFDYGSSASMKMLIWEDPTDYYEWYDPPGQVSLMEMVDGEWFTRGTASEALDLSVDEGEWVTLEVQVDDGRVTGFFNGDEVLSADTEGGDGPLQVGVWTWDNDGGVCFSDVLVSLL